MTGAFAGPIFLKPVDERRMEKVLQPVFLAMVVVMGILLVFK
jgi:hypothetical protein